MIYIGIDPGQKGAIAAVGNAINACAFPLPFNAKELNVSNVVEWFQYSCESYFTRVFVEKQFVMPKQGAVSGFRCGLEYGRLLGCLQSRYAVEIVPAKTWKAVMLPGENKSDKSASIRVAKRLFPGVSLRRTERCKKDDDGMAEALLIAEYGRRTMG